MKRELMIVAIEERGSYPWDIIIIGGGATGLGAAVEAASRDMPYYYLSSMISQKAHLAEVQKLVHGGVRYLQQGDIGLVLEALRERGLLRQNAPICP